MQIPFKSIRGGSMHLRFTGGCHAVNIGYYVLLSDHQEIFFLFHLDALVCKSLLVGHRLYGVILVVIQFSLLVTSFRQSYIS
jgi:hypothetical protein